MLAVAAESLVKLLAFLAVGAFAVWGLFGGLGALTEIAAAARDRRARSRTRRTRRAGSWPRCCRRARRCCCRASSTSPSSRTRDSRDIRAAAWLFPALSRRDQPVRAAAGASRGWRLFRSRASIATSRCWRCRCSAGAPALALTDDDRRPLGGDRDGGGRERRAGDHRLQRSRHADAAAPPRRAGARRPKARSARWCCSCAARRSSACWRSATLYARLASDAALASIGLLSFAGGGADRAGLSRRPVLAARHGARRGGGHDRRLAGLALSAAAALARRPTARLRSMLRDGPLGLAWLRPAALVAFAPHPLVGGVALSLGLNMLAFVAGLADAPADAARAHAGDRLRRRRAARARARRSGSGAPRRRSATSRRRSRASSARRGRARSFDALFAERGLDETRRAPRPTRIVIRHAEHLLSPAIGASTSRLVLSLLLRRRAMSGKSALKMLDDASAAIQSSRDLLQHALDHARQGITRVRRQSGADRLEPRIRRTVRPAAVDAARGARARRDRALQRRARRSTGRAPPTISSPSGSPACSTTTSRCGCGCIRRSACSRCARRGCPTAASSPPTPTSPRPSRSRTNSPPPTRGWSGASASAPRNWSGSTRNSRAPRPRPRTPISRRRAFSPPPATTSCSRSTPRGSMRVRWSRAAADAPAEERANLARNVDASLEAVEEILGALLDISRLDAGATQAGDRRRFARRYVPPARDRIRADGARQGPEADLRRRRALAVRSDRRLLRRLLQNFVSNAIKYTPRGRVLVGARRRGATCAIEVWDTGLGIPESKRAARVRRVPAARPGREGRARARARPLDRGAARARARPSDRAALASTGAARCSASTAPLEPRRGRGAGRGAGRRAGRARATRSRACACSPSTTSRACWRACAR